MKRSISPEPNRGPHHFESWADNLVFLHAPLRNRLTFLVSATASLPVAETARDTRTEAFALSTRGDALDSPRPDLHRLGFILLQLRRERIDIIRFGINGEAVNFHGILDDNLPSPWTKAW